MAVPEQTPYIEHTGNGVTTSFSLGFQCESKDHLIVLVDEIEPPIATWSLFGGNVVFTTAPAAGKKITLQRNTPFNRTTDYQSYNNSFRPPAVNKDFDWIWWKLQELGVADWILGARIDALKNYVDRKDDELKAYLMEEIRKQGVALDQLDDYYNYLMQRLAQIAVDKGWDASFVVDASGKTQQEINNKTIRTVESISDLANLKVWEGRVVTVLSDGYNWLFENNNWSKVDLITKNGGSLESHVSEYVPEDFGLTLDGITDQGEALQSVFTAMAALDGYNVLNCKGLEVLTSNTSLLVRIDKFKLKNLVVRNTLTSSTTPFVTLRFVSNRGTSSTKPPTIIVENVVVNGAVQKGVSNVHGVAFYGIGSNIECNGTIKDLNVAQFKNGICFGSNTYLLAFDGGGVTQCDVPLTDTVVAGIESSVANAGENYSFTNGHNISNSNSIFNFTNLEANANFFNCSWDYCGGSVIRRNGTTINFIGGHYETNKTFDAIFDSVGALSYINFAPNMMIGRGGVINYVAKDGGSGSCRLRFKPNYVSGFNASSLNYIADTNPIESSPMFIATGLTNRVSSLSYKFMCDPNFSTATNVDNWYVSGTRANLITSDEVAAVFTTITINSVTYNAMKLTKLSGMGVSASVSLPIDLIRSKYSFDASVKFYMQNVSGLTAENYLRLTQSYRNKTGLSASTLGTPVFDASTLNKNISATVLPTGEIQTLVTTERHANILVENSRYNCGLVIIDMFALPVNSEIYVLECNVNRHGL